VRLAGPAQAELDRKGEVRVRDGNSIEWNEWCRRIAPSREAALEVAADMASNAIKNAQKEIDAATSRRDAAVLALDGFMEDRFDVASMGDRDAEDVDCVTVDMGEPIA
jgi:hypothetical protein